MYSLAVIIEKINPDGTKQVWFRPEGIYFTIMTAGLYIISLIMRLLAKTIEDIPPKYLFNYFLAV